MLLGPDNSLTLYIASSGLSGLVLNSERRQHLHQQQSRSEAA